MASILLSYPCDHCSSKFLLSVVCVDVGSSSPVSTLLKNVRRLAYDFFFFKKKQQTKNRVDSAHKSSHPHTALGWLFMCFQESLFCAVPRNLLCGNAGCPSQGQCSFSVPSQLKVQPLQSCSDVQGGCQCPASALRMLSFGSPSTQGCAVVSLRPEALTTVLSVLT